MTASAYLCVSIISLCMTVGSCFVSPRRALRYVLALSGIALALLSLWLIAFALV